MNTKEKNYVIARKIGNCAFFREPYYHELFASDATIDFPYAPPGMPQFFDQIETKLCFSWLVRTVKSYKASLAEIYGSEDPSVFWIIGDIKAEVYWGKHDGLFQSRYFSRLHIHDEKIRYLKVWLDPLEFCRAAGKEIPTFHMNLNDSQIDEYLKNKRSAKTKPDDKEIDLSDEACEIRKSINIGRAYSGSEREWYRPRETYSENYRHVTWFLPDGMCKLVNARPGDRFDEKNIPDEFKERAGAWIKVSSPTVFREPDALLWQTDNINVLFSEAVNHGQCNWVGNNCPNGHYRQRYLNKYVYDDAGRVLEIEEVLNPINKYNSCNISVPSFPYYL